MQDQLSNSLNICVVTVSDTRTPENDTSGDFLSAASQDAGHSLIEHQIVKDDIYQIRALLSAYIAADNIDVVLMTGGTGFSGRDSTPEAVAPLFDKAVEGFGELFRAVSYEEIGSSTVQSRALAGISNNTAVFCVPGSTGACKTAWQRILREQLDVNHKPCNFVAVLNTKAQ